LLSEKTAKEAEIEKLKEQITETAQRITEQATAQALRSKDAQENRNKIIEQAEKAVNNAVYKVGQTISQNSAVGKAMMLAALELQEQVTERQIER
jgi:cation transport regulator ChaB